MLSSAPRLVRSVWDKKDSRWKKSQCTRVLTVNCSDSMQHRVTSSERAITYGQSLRNSIRKTDGTWLTNPQRTSKAMQRNITLAAVAVAAPVILTACGGGGGGTTSTAPVTPPAADAGYFSSAPIASITLNDPNACYTSLVSAIDLDGDGKKDLATHHWCFQFNVLAGFNGPTPDTFNVYLNKTTGFQNANQQLFGSATLSLGGSSRKVVQGDLNGDGKMELAYVINREDGRPIGNNLSVAESQAMIVASSANGYVLNKVGVPTWFHTVDFFQSDANTKAVVFQGFGGPGPQGFVNTNNGWSTVNNLPFLSGLTYRFMKSSPSASADDIVVTVGSGAASDLDIFTKVGTTWQKGVGYAPPVTLNAVPVIGWNKDSYLVNRLEFNGSSYFGAGFDESCLIRKTPTSPQLFVGRFSGRKLPSGYVSGQTVREDGTPIDYDLIAFEVNNGNLPKVDLGLDASLGNDPFFHFECTDVNGDGYDDIVLSRERAGAMPDIYLNNKSGKFVKVPTNVFPNSSIRGRGMLADMDGDGISDLIIFDVANNDVSVKKEPSRLQVYKGLKRL